MGQFFWSCFLFCLFFCSVNKHEFKQNFFLLSWDRNYFCLKICLEILFQNSVSKFCQLETLIFHVKVKQNFFKLTQNIIFSCQLKTEIFHVISKQNFSFQPETAFFHVNTKQNFFMLTQNRNFSCYLETEFFHFNPKQHFFMLTQNRNFSC